MSYLARGPDGFAVPVPLPTVKQNAVAATHPSGFGGEGILVPIAASGDVNTIYGLRPRPASVPAATAETAELAVRNNGSVAGGPLTTAGARAFNVIVDPLGLLPPPRPYLPSVMGSLSWLHRVVPSATIQQAWGPPATPVPCSYCAARSPLCPNCPSLWY